MATSNTGWQERSMSRSRRQRSPADSFSTARRCGSTRSSLYQPDALVYCGEPVSGDALEIPNPVVVFEVLSPGNAVTDLRDKLVGYFRVASIAHYLIVDPDKRIVIHHARGTGDVVSTRILSEGAVRLDPPGIEIAVGELFG